MGFVLCASMLDIFQHSLLLISSEWNKIVSDLGNKRIASRSWKRRSANSGRFESTNRRRRISNWNGRCQWLRARPIWSHSVFCLVLLWLAWTNFLVGIHFLFKSSTNPSILLVYKQRAFPSSFRRGFFAHSKLSLPGTIRCSIFCSWRINCASSNFIFI